MKLWPAPAKEKARYREHCQPERAYSKSPKNQSFRRAQPHVVPLMFEAKFKNQDGTNDKHDQMKEKIYCQRMVDGGLAAGQENTQDQQKKHHLSGERDINHDFLERSSLS